MCLPTCLLLEKGAAMLSEQAQGKQLASGSDPGGSTCRRSSCMSVTQCEVLAKSSMLFGAGCCCWQLAAVLSLVCLSTDAYLQCRSSAGSWGSMAPAQGLAHSQSSTSWLPLLTHRWVTAAATASEQACAAQPPAPQMSWLPPQPLPSLLPARIEVAHVDHALLLDNFLPGLDAALSAWMLAPALVIDCAGNLVTDA